MAILYLPRLKENHENGLVLPARAGLWSDEQARGRVEILAHAVATQTDELDQQDQQDQQKQQRQEIHSIPDPWGRFLLFARALKEEDHPLHEAIRGEWRGMLALFGLREIRRFDFLDMKLVDLSRAEDEGSGSFTRVLARLLPGEQDLIDPETTFLKFYLVKAHSRPRGMKPPRVFGITSPSTLVATGAHYDGVFDPKVVPWFDGEKFVDPCGQLNNRAILNDHERTALAEWVHRLKRNIAAVKSDSPYHRMLLERLAEYATALDKHANADPGPEIISDALPLKLTEGVFKSLAKAHRGSSGVVTELEIVSQGKGTGYVLVDPLIAPLLSEEHKAVRSLNEIVAYDNFTLEAAAALAGKKTSGQFPGDQGMNWCTPAFIFQNSIICEETPRASKAPDNGKSNQADEDAFPGCYKAKSDDSSSPSDDIVRQIAFPLSTAALNLFSIQELVDNFRVKWEEDGSAICRLTFTVRTVAKGTPQTGDAPPVIRRITIEKPYKKEEIVRLRRIPPVYIWPDFRFHDDKDGNNRWKKYYLFESWRGMSDTQTFAIKPLHGDDRDQRIIPIGDEQFQLYPDRKSTRLNSSHQHRSRMPSSA